MTGLKDWSTTAASNNASPPYGAPENTTLVSDLNNIDREVMAQVRGFYEQPLWRNLGLAFQATGGSNAVVLTGNVSTHFASGQRVYVTDASTSQYATISNVSVATHTTLTVDITVTHPVSAMLTGPNPANDPLTVVALQGIDGLETSLAGSATKLATAGAIKSVTDLHRLIPQTPITLTSTTSWTLSTASGEVYERIELAFSSVSGSGGIPLIRIGSGSMATSGYAGSAGSLAGDAGAITNGFVIAHAGGSFDADTYSGNAVLQKVVGNTWSISGCTYNGNAPNHANHFSGKIGLGGALDRVGFAYNTGTFDDGSAQAYVSRSA